MALTRTLIVSEALDLLDDRGLNGVTLRVLAKRLGVRAPTLYWHVRDKAELIDALGEAILAESLTDLPDPADMAWNDWLVEAGSRFRLALLSHRDGARVVAGSQSSPTLAAFSERAMALLVEHGVSLRNARLLVLLVERFTLGLVLEEQSEPHIDPTLEPAVIATQYPTLTAATTDYFADGNTLDDLYRDSIRLITHRGLGSHEFT